MDPTRRPTVYPSKQPSQGPTYTPSYIPSKFPSYTPTKAPTIPKTWIQGPIFLRYYIPMNETLTNFNNTLLQTEIENKMRESIINTTTLNSTMLYRNLSK